MIAQQHNNHFGPPITLRRSNSFLLLFFISTAVLAAANGALQLPESYRTPLTEMVYDNNKEWRAQTEEDNPWRGGEEEPSIKPRLKAEFFPEYDYNTVDNPNTRSLFQNEDELERPRTNIFKYTF
jgi:hypothetical protein